jgi:hypothetical protein
MCCGGRKVSEAVTNIVDTKFRYKGYRYPIKLIYTGTRIFVQFPYNPGLKDEIKETFDAKWHGYDEKPVKLWSIEDSARSAFQIAYLEGKNPYARFDNPWPVLDFERPLYDHQCDMTRFVLGVHYCILACEMGTGKTLVVIEAMERSGLAGHEIWYVGPKAGVKAVALELDKWNARIRPHKMLTYDAMVKVVKEWRDGQPAPAMVIFDESSKLKTPTSQRSQQALHLADAVRAEHGNSGFVIQMSGTPAPRTPADWWHQCEVAYPGFIKEANIHRFRNRLCISEMRENPVTGGTFPHIVTWRDDEKKCNECGQVEGQHFVLDHDFVPSRNEVSYLYERMKGLVLVKFKKDCMDLPEIQYQIIKITPTASILRAAKLIRATCSRGVEALTKMRELSDGFQYGKEKIGIEDCPECQGSCKVVVPVPTERVDVDSPTPNTEIADGDFTYEELDCVYCGGAGKVPVYARSTEEVDSPKDEVLIDMLDTHEDIGRFIAWGGFKASVDRIIDIAHRQGWTTLRVDGRGYAGESATGDRIDDTDLLIAMDRSHPRFKELLEEHPRICFVGHPKAGGMALNLSASPSELFYSNCFDGEARSQAEQRFHRPSLDKNRGATVYDIIHLPTDKLVLDNLQKKRRMEKVTMGEIVEAFEE